MPTNGYMNVMLTRFPFFFTNSHFKLLAVSFPNYLGVFTYCIELTSEINDCTRISTINANDSP